MKRLLPAALATALLLASPLAAAPQDAPGARAARVRALFAELDEREGPGVAVAVVRDGRVLVSDGYGLASLEHRVPITSSTVFDLASLSKQFTGLAIAMLVEEGKVRLEDDIRTYIPELPDFGRRMTVDHLVHHTSGLRDWPGALSVAGWRYDDVISFDQILRMAYHQQDLNFDPGSEYTYSNTGYNLLAELVARVTGRSYREWMDARVFRPLGMTRTHIHDNHTEVVRDRAYGYGGGRDGVYRRTPNNLTALGSSSMFSTADDMARWLLHLEEPVVGGAAAAERTRIRGVLDDGSSIAYAFGMSHGSYRGAATLTHSGSWASFRTFLVHFPERRFGVVVLANSPAINPSRAAYDIADIYLDDLAAPSADRADPAPVGVPSSVLGQYVGVYRLGPGWYVTVRREGAGLVIRATDEEEAPMLPISEAELWVEAYGASMAFERDEAGHVVALTYRGRRAPKLEDRDPPGPARLAELAGEYESDELGTSYTVAIADGELVMRHRRHGTLPLTHAWGEDFRGPVGFLASVEFQRDEAGRVIGLLVNAGERNRDLRFERR